jgi:hypothetical protein
MIHSGVAARVRAMKMVTAMQGVAPSRRRAGVLLISMNSGAT